MVSRMPTLSTGLHMLSICKSSGLKHQHSSKNLAGKPSQREFVTALTKLMLTKLHKNFCILLSKLESLRKCTLCLETLLSTDERGMVPTVLATGLGLKEILKKNSQELEVLKMKNLGLSGRMTPPQDLPQKSRMKWPTTLHSTLGVNLNNHIKRLNIKDMATGDLDNN
jgi:hypothetical protein